MTHVADGNGNSMRAGRILSAVLAVALAAVAVVTVPNVATAAQTGQLSGIVTLDTAGGAPASGIVVQAFSRGSEPGWAVDPEYPTAVTTTGTDGSYTLVTPSTGAYMVVAVPTEGDGRAPGVASTVTVTTSTPTVNFTLVPGAKLAGAIVSPTGAALAGASIRVYLQDTGERFSWFTKTGADGAFAFDPLPAGEYKVNAYADGYDDFQLPLTVTPSQTIDDLTVSMPPLASISGRVTSSTDLEQGIEGIVVTRNGVSTTTAADGTWKLSDDQYQTSDFLAFSDPTQNYLPQWWNGSPTRVGANGIHLTAGQQATGYNAQLVPASSVSGTVTAFGDGNPIANVQVSVFVPNTGSEGKTVYTDSAGNYSVRGLPAGTYSASFIPPGSTFARKTVQNLVVLRGKTVTTNAVLDRTSGIVGKVTFEGPGSVDLTTVRLRMTGQTVRPDAQGNFAFTGLSGGAYKFEVIPDDRVTYVSRWYEDGTELADATPVVVKANEPPTAVNVVVPLQKYPKTTRVPGADRYAVAVAVSKKAFPGGAPTVYIATGENYPDALSAGPAAVVQGGPLLMTPKNTLPADVKTEIQRLKPARIVVVGGQNSVSPAVFSALKALQPNTTRLDGADRFTVSQKLALEVFGDSGADIVYVATGLNFPDALGAGSAAGFQGGPVLLVNGLMSSLDQATKSVLSSLDPDRIFIAGGPASVSPGIAEALAAYGAVERLGGADRYEASAAIGLNAYASSSEAFLVTGGNFPDALSGSAWAGHLGAPLYVSRPDCVPQVTLDALHKQGVKKLTLIGGPNSLSAAVLSLKPCG